MDGFGCLGFRGLGDLGFGLLRGVQGFVVKARVCGWSSCCLENSDCKLTILP